MEQYYIKPGREEATSPYVPPITPEKLPPAATNEEIAPGHVVVPKIVPVDDTTEKHQITAKTLLMVLTASKNKRPKLTFRGCKGTYDSCFFTKVAA